MIKATLRKIEGDSEYKWELVYEDMKIQRFRKKADARAAFKARETRLEDAELIEEKPEKKEEE